MNVRTAVSRHSATDAAFLPDQEGEQCSCSPFFVSRRRTARVERHTIHWRFRPAPACAAGERSREIQKYNSPFPNGKDFPLRRQEKPMPAELICSNGKNIPPSIPADRAEGGLRRKIQGISGSDTAVWAFWVLPAPAHTTSRRGRHWRNFSASCLQAPPSSARSHRFPPVFWLRS